MGMVREICFPYCHIKSTLESVETGKSPSRLAVLTFSFNLITANVQKDTSVLRLVETPTMAIQALTPLVGPSCPYFVS